MKEKNLIIICITAIICVVILSATILVLNANTAKTNNTTNENDTVNITLNDTNNTQNNTTTTATKSTKKTTTKKSSDPDYDPERDASHQGATKDNPVTVQQSDGEYTYYGSGHYDYYAGGNHMSGEYYKYKNSHPTDY